MASIETFLPFLNCISVFCGINAKSSVYGLLKEDHLAPCAGSEVVGTLSFAISTKFEGRNMRKPWKRA